MTRPPKRATYGEGTKPYRRTDGRWAASIEAGYTERGTRRRITRTGKTEAEVKGKIKELKRQIAKDGLPAVSSRSTVKSWAEVYLGIKELKLAPSSFNATRVAVRKWIIPTIGHKRIESLTPADVRAVATAQREEGKSSSTQLRTHSVLMDMLKRAVKEGHRVPPRVLIEDAPEKAVNDRDAMSTPEMMDVLAQAGRHPDGFRWVLALSLGMRQAEVLGLTWPQVDLELGTIIVSWQLQPLPYRIKRDRTSGFRVPEGYESRQIKGALHLVRPKSKAGYRVAPLLPDEVTALRMWQAIAPDSPHGLVWPTLDGGPRLARDDDAAWYALQDAAGVRHPAGRHYTTHEARHTASTRMMEAGIDEAVRLKIMGHSSIASQRAYQHVRTEHALDARGKVAERLELG